MCMSRQEKIHRKQKWSIYWHGDGSISQRIQMNLIIHIVHRNRFVGLVIYLLCLDQLQNVHHHYSCFNWCFTNEPELAIFSSVFSTYLEESLWFFVSQCPSYYSSNRPTVSKPWSKQFHYVRARSRTVWTGMPYRYFSCRPEAITTLAIQEIWYRYDAQNMKMCITGQNISVLYVSPRLMALCPGLGSSGQRAIERVVVVVVVVVVVMVVVVVAAAAAHFH